MDAGGSPSSGRSSYPCAGNNMSVVVSYDTSRYQFVSVSRKKVATARAAGGAGARPASSVSRNGTRAHPGREVAMCAGAAPCHDLIVKHKSPAGQRLRHLQRATRAPSPQGPPCTPASRPSPQESQDICAYRPSDLPSLSSANSLRSGPSLRLQIGLRVLLCGCTRRRSNGPSLPDASDARPSRRGLRR